MVRPNKPYTQPRYPCSDADPFLAMRQFHFRDEENGPYVFWADVPEVDVLAEDNSVYLQPLTIPKEYPKRFAHIRPPRCVRLITAGITESQSSGGPSDENQVQIKNYYQPFALQIRNVCRNMKADIYFQWMVGSTILYALPFPAYTPEIFNTYPDPENGAGRYDFDTTMIEDGCVFFGETLTISINDVLSGGQWVVAFPDPPESQDHFRFEEPRGLKIDVGGYWDLWYDKAPKLKWIFQADKNIDIYDTSVYGDDFNAQNQYQANLMENLASAGKRGWVIGPDFEFDVGYVESQIRDFWNL